MEKPRLSALNQLLFHGMCSARTVAACVPSLGAPHIPSAGRAQVTQIAQKGAWRGTSSGSPGLKQELFCHPTPASEVQISLGSQRSKGCLQ